METNEKKMSESLFENTDFSNVKDRGAPTEWITAPEDGSNARFLGRIVSAEYDKDEVKGARVFIKIEVVEARQNCTYSEGNVVTYMIKPNAKAGGSEGFINSLANLVADLEGVKASKLEDPKASLTAFFDNNYAENPITAEVTYVRHKVNGVVIDFTKVFFGAAE